MRKKESPLLLKFTKEERYKNFTMLAADKCEKNESLKKKLSPFLQDYNIWKP